MCLHRKCLFICVAFVHLVSICSIVIRVSFGVLQLFLLPSLHNTPLVMRVRNIYVSDHRHIAANAYKRPNILSPCFQLKTRLLQEHPKMKVTHTQSGIRKSCENIHFHLILNQKYSYLKKEGSISFLASFGWRAGWMYCYSFGKNHLLSSSMSWQRTKHVSAIDSTSTEEKNNTETEYCEQLKNTDICVKVDVIWIKSRFFGIVTEMCMQSFVSNRVLFIRLMVGQCKNEIFSNFSQ